MEELSKDAEEIARTKQKRKTEGFIGYWVPGGVGYNHVKPKAKVCAGAVELGW